MTGPNQQRAREKYRRLVGVYDRRIALIAPLRRRVVNRLGLSAGETCLDVACGTGINFGLIEARIGPAGRLIGVDLSPEMLARAGERVASEGWRNVSLVEANVEEAALPSAPDAVLFSLTHDVLQMPGGLAKIFEQLYAAQEDRLISLSMKEGTT